MQIDGMVFEILMFSFSIFKLIYLPSRKNKFANNFPGIGSSCLLVCGLAYMSVFLFNGHFLISFLLMKYANEMCMK